MALYFYFNETTGDLVYSDQATYGAEGYTSLGEQTNMAPSSETGWVYDQYRSSIRTVAKDSASGRIVGLTSMYYMFRNCPSLTSLDLSGFDTSKVTTMAAMFQNCSGLTSLDLSGLDTSRVTNMGSMFVSCSGLTSLDLSGLDTSRVTTMYSMFSRCSRLTSLDLSGFDTSQVTSMQYMFQTCSSLTSLDLSGFDTSKVTSMSNMFQNCSSLVSLDLSGFDTSQVTSTTSMFPNCPDLRLIAVSGSMSNVLSQLPSDRYYPASGGSPVAKASLTAGTWVRDKADLSLVATLVETSQAAMALRRKLTSLAKRVAKLESGA